MNKNSQFFYKKKQDDLEKRIRQINVKENSITSDYLKTLDGIRRYYIKLVPEGIGKKMEQWLGCAIEEYIKEHNLDAKTAKSIFGNLDGFINKECVRDLIKKHSQNELLQKRVKQAISSRKREYQRLESENSELIVSSPGYFIGLSGRGITLRKNGQPVKTPPTAALKHISILSQGVSISSNAIAFCMENNIPIDFFDFHNKHIASILSPKYMQTTLWERQSALSTVVSNEIGKRIILGKVKNQFSLAKYFNKYHKQVGVEEAFNNYRNAIEEIINKIKAMGLKEEKFRQTIMSYEAVAANSYWEYVRELIKDDIEDFYSRVKQGASDIVNCMLNYGYALLYPRVWQAVLKHRLNPYIGFIHYSEGNANLVFDIMELFRTQAVDRIVISLIQKKESLKMSSGKLDSPTRSRLARCITERLNRKEIYRGREMSFLLIIDSQLRELTDSIVNKKTFRPYLAKW